VLPVSCVSPFDYITCQPAVDGACPTRSCKYTATRCTYVPNMPLQTLLLSGYDLTILPETFGHTMSVLERLHLNDNQLTQLPDGFGTGMVSLKHLYLHNNQLDSLPTGFGAQMVSLQHLNLGANKLTSAAITDAALALPESLRKLHLEVDTLGDTCTAKMQNVERHGIWFEKAPEPEAVLRCSLAIRRGADEMAAESNEDACNAVLAEDGSADCVYVPGLAVTEDCATYPRCVSNPTHSAPLQTAECLSGFDENDPATCPPGCTYGAADPANMPVCEAVTAVAETCVPPTDDCADGFVQGSILDPSTSCKPHCTLSGTSALAREAVVSIDGAAGIITLDASHMVVASQHVRLADATAEHTCAAATNDDMVVTGVSHSDFMEVSRHDIAGIWVAFFQKYRC